MILTLGQTAETIIVTLNEKRTLTTGYYLFLFTHYTTKEIVTKIYNFTEDDSAYPDRFNSFEINTSVVFSGRPTGQWKYSIYEQASSSNTDTDLALTEVEKGILTLKPATEFSYIKYNEPSIYTAYNG